MNKFRSLLSIILIAAIPAIGFGAVLSLWGTLVDGDTITIDMLNELVTDVKAIDTRTTALESEWVQQADCSTITAGCCLDNDGANEGLIYCWDGDSVGLAIGSGTGVVELSDCSSITEGLCLDTDDGLLYYYDGDSVELIITASGPGELNSIAQEGSALEDDDTLLAEDAQNSYGKIRILLSEVWTYIQTKLLAAYPDLDTDSTDDATMSSDDGELLFDSSGVATGLDEWTFSGQELTLGENAAINGIDTIDLETLAKFQVGSNPIIESIPWEMCVAASDESTDLTTGTAKLTFRMPCAVTLTSVRGSVSTASSDSGSTLLTVDINESGSTILSTKLTFDETEETTTTATTAAVISDTALADDSEITIDIDSTGDTAAGKGLKICFIGARVSP